MYEEKTIYHYRRAVLGTGTPALILLCVASLSFYRLSLSILRYGNSFATVLSYRYRTKIPKRSAHFATPVETKDQSTEPKGRCAVHRKGEQLQQSFNVFISRHLVRSICIHALEAKQATCSRRKGCTSKYPDPVICSSLHLTTGLPEMTVHHTYTT